MCVPSVHNLRVHGKEGNVCLGKLAIDALDSSMMKKRATDSRTKGMKSGSTCGILG